VADDTYKPTRYRLSTEDRANYGGPEWVTFDRNQIFELPASKIMELEGAIGATIGQFLAANMQGSGFGVKATLFIARRFAGIKEEFRTFDPHIFACDSEPVESESEPEPDPTLPIEFGSEKPE